MFVVFLLCCFVSAAWAGPDYAYLWGDRMHAACTAQVRESMGAKKLPRGLCDMLQDLLERFLGYVGRVRSEAHGLALERELLPRLEEARRRRRREGGRELTGPLRSPITKDWASRASVALWSWLWTRAWCSGTGWRTISTRGPRYSRAGGGLRGLALTGGGALSEVDPNGVEAAGEPAGN